MNVGWIIGIAVLAFFGYIVLRSIGAFGKDAMDMRRRSQEKRRMLDDLAARAAERRSDSS